MLQSNIENEWKNYPFLSFCLPRNMSLVCLCIIMRTIATEMEPIIGQVPAKDIKCRREIASASIHFIFLSVSQLFLSASRFLSAVFCSILFRRYDFNNYMLSIISDQAVGIISAGWCALVAATNACIYTHFIMSENERKKMKTSNMVKPGVSVSSSPRVYTYMLGYKITFPLLLSFSCRPQLRQYASVDLKLQSIQSVSLIFD